MIERQRSSLFLIELLLALLFFALIAAVCVQIFVSAHQLSAADATAGRAALLAQSAAETYKAASGDLRLVAENLPLLTAEAGALRQYYDQDGRPCPEAEAAYILLLTAEDAAPPGLRQARLTLSDARERQLIALTLAVQEAI